MSGQVRPRSGGHVDTRRASEQSEAHGTTGRVGRPPAAAEVWIAELADLHPQSARSSRALALLNHVNEGLTKFNPDFTVAPGLAERWTVSDDGKTYTFTLRPGVKWHDGQDLSADDISFTFNLAMADDSRAAAKGMLATNVESVEAQGSEVVITLKQAYSPLLSVLAGQVGILPKHVLESDPYLASFTASPIGTGPYKVTSRDISTLTIETNPD